MTAQGDQHRQGRLTVEPGETHQLVGAATGLHPLGMGGRRDGVLLVPDDLDPTVPAPLVVALHGAGGEASQMVNMLGAQARARGFVLLAPDSRGPTWDVIRSGFGPDVAFLDSALRDAFAARAIDRQRIAVSGFSDGASYALSLGLVNGAFFSDVLAFSPGFMAPTEQQDSPRIFISHGVRDEVLPIDRCSRRLAPALERAGYDVDYQEFAGGHVVSDEMVDLALDRFLTADRAGSAVRTPGNG